MSATPRVMIVGAGIAGLTTAIALTNAGMDVTVLERAATVDDVAAGGGLVLWHNAMLAAKELGLADSVAAAGHELRSHEFFSDRGRRLARWSVADMTERHGAPACAIQRSTLHRLLADTAGEVRFGARCVGVHGRPDHVVAELSDGTGIVADLCVGADGLRSAVRRALRGHEPPPRYAGYTAWQAVVDVPDATVPEGTLVNMWGRGLRFLYFRLDDQGTVYWDGVTSDQVLASTPPEPRADALLRRLFASWPAPVPQLIDSTPNEAILPVDIHDRPPVAGWTLDRVALVGDAAHPMTFNLGQGACQAIEDAVTLARCLLGDRDVTSALRNYERRRRVRVADIVRTSWTIGAIGRWRSRAACRARDALMRATFDRIAMRKSYELMMNTGWER
ncbi:MAG: FAD-dependent oxidoreductase [Chloroflexota bacterium]|nr:FAD-dependent oxidoreductase [Chloroflexota bacterium]